MCGFIFYAFTYTLKYSRKPNFDFMQNFNILTDDINWKQYITNYSIGSKLYITKETPQDYAIARRRRLRFSFIRKLKLFQNHPQHYVKIKKI